MQFCKIRPGELDLFSLRDKYNWCLYKKIIRKKVKTVQGKHKYSHEEKKGVQAVRDKYWLKIVLHPRFFFFFQSGSGKKEITLTKGFVKDGAVCLQPQESLSESDKAALPSPAPFGCRSRVWLRGDSVNSPSFVWFCPGHLQRCKLFKSRLWLSVSIRHFHIPVLICRLKCWDF